MTNMQAYWQAAQDFRSADDARRITGLANLMRLASEPDSLIQRQADHLTKIYGVCVLRGGRPNFTELTVVSPANLTR